MKITLDSGNTMEDRDQVLVGYCSKCKDEKTFCHYHHWKLTVGTHLAQRFANMGRWFCTDCYWNNQQLDYEYPREELVA